MQEPIEQLKRVLDGTLNIDVAVGKTMQYIEAMDEKSRYLPVLRALNSLSENKMMDFCGHLRQCMNYYICGFNITKEIYEKLFEHKNMFGFIFDHGGENVVNIDPQIMPDSEDLKSKYIFESRRMKKPSVGDGKLYNFYRYSTYTSLSQKVLMYQIANMDKNETVLACLPTGGGKSMTWHLPAISKSYNGIIIVVVPTVALAIDHERTSRNAFDNANISECYPLAYYGGIDRQKKKQIYDGIESGTLPILYISPEALLISEFQNKIIEAAKNGKVSALFIDEAHLIVNWGVKFRPEFQLLVPFREKLRSNSPNGLRTVLLSATFTDEDTEMIRKIFDDEVFTEYRADEQRAEPSYYLHECSSEEERINCIKQLVCQVPKPIIVYTVSPEEGDKYYRAIKEMGFNNIEIFTGDTKNVKRKSIIKDWNDNKIDIIVATSAFGMGVDKADVRTIITAYIPETISRFYQEVGRAGRDGYAALNYFLYFEEIDNKYVKSLTKGTVITVPLLAKRWKELLASAGRVSADKVWLDVNVAPEHLKFKPTGKYNAGWNKDVVLLLYRSGLVEIIDVKKINDDDYKILVHLENIKILENPKLLENYMESYREEERDRVNRGIASVKKMLKNADKDCYSKFICDEFPLTERVCNGCPYCRKNNLSHFYHNGSIRICSTKDKKAKSYELLTTDTFDIFLKTSKSLMMTVDESLAGEELFASIEFFVRKGVNIIVVPDEYDKECLLEKLSFIDNSKYLILTLDETLQINIRWLYGICALFYTNNDDYNECLYKFAVDYINMDENNKIIHIALDNQYIKSEMRQLGELVDQNLSGGQYIFGDTAAI